MPGIARVGDQTYGFCYYAWRWHHTTYYCGWWSQGQWGNIIGFSPTTNANTLGCARLGDLASHLPNPSAPVHSYLAIISSGSGSVNVDGQPVARIGDACAPNPYYVANIVSGSPDVNST